MSSNLSEIQILRKERKEKDGSTRRAATCDKTDADCLRLTSSRRSFCTLETATTHRTDHVHSFVHNLTFTKYNAAHNFYIYCLANTSPLIAPLHFHTRNCLILHHTHTRASAFPKTTHPNNNFRPTRLLLSSRKTTLTQTNSN